MERIPCHLCYRTLKPNEHTEHSRLCYYSNIGCQECRELVPLYGFKSHFLRHVPKGIVKPLDVFKSLFGVIGQRTYVVCTKCDGVVDYLGFSEHYMQCCNLVAGPDTYIKCFLCNSHKKLGDFPTHTEKSKYYRNTPTLYKLITHVLRGLYYDTIVNPNITGNPEPPNEEMVQQLSYAYIQRYTDLYLSK